MKAIFIDKLPELNNDYDSKLEKLLINSPNWITPQDIPFGYQMYVTLITDVKINVREYSNYLPELFDLINIKEIIIDNYISEEPDTLRMIVRWEEIKPTTKELVEIGKDMYSQDIPIREICRKLNWEMMSFYHHVLNKRYGKEV